MNDDILHNATMQNISVIFVTNRERIFGLSDQVIDIKPSRTLLDVGTDNSQLLNASLYMGWRYPYMTGTEYFEFLEMFISAVKCCWPNLFLRFEDFVQQTAMQQLNH